MVANPARSEQSLVVAGREHKLLYTHHALALLEAQLGRSVLEIATSLMHMRFGFREVHACVLAGLEGWRVKHNPDAEPWTLERVHDLLDLLEDATVARDITSAALEHAGRRMFPDLMPTDEDDDAPKAMASTTGSEASA
jgi:hypothetical protein